MKTKLLRYTDHLAQALNIAAHNARVSQNEFVMRLIIKALYETADAEVMTLVDQHAIATDGIERSP